MAEKLAMDVADNKYWTKRKEAMTAEAAVLLAKHALDQAIAAVDTGPVTDVLLTALTAAREQHLTASRAYSDAMLATKIALGEKEDAMTEWEVAEQKRRSDKRKTLKLPEATKLPEVAEPMHTKLVHAQDNLVKTEAASDLGELAMLHSHHTLAAMDYQNGTTDTMKLIKNKNYLKKKNGDKMLLNAEHAGPLRGAATSERGAGGGGGGGGSSDYSMSAHDKYEMSPEDYQSQAFTKPTAFVTNLTLTTTKQDIYKLFHLHGNITDIRMIMNKGRRNHFAFVQFQDDHSARNTIAKLNRQLLNGNVIKLCWAKGSKTHPTVFIYHIHHELTVDELGDFFQSTVGGLLETRIQLNHQTGESTGCGFALFKTEKQAAKAISLDGYKLKGCKIGIEKSKFDLN